MIKLSRVSTLDGIFSWSLLAIATCPGSREPNGALVDVCQVCYAREGHYFYPSVQAAREHNRRDWKRPCWVNRMVAALDTERYFRWFDSGDIYDHRLAQKILLVVRQTPWCKHWIPTRSHKIDRIRPILEEINTEPNACVRYSSDQIGEYTPGLHGSVVLRSDRPTPDGVTPCLKYTNDPVRCNGCRACWDKAVDTIAYLAHGQRMKKHIRLTSAPKEISVAA